jgi:hypothetical protein
MERKPCHSQAEGGISVVRQYTSLTFITHIQKFPCSITDSGSQLSAVIHINTSTTRVREEVKITDPEFMHWGRRHTNEVN